MGKQTHFTGLEITAGAYIFLAVAALLIPLRLFAAWLIAVAVHECCHLAAVWLTGGQCNGVQIGMCGAKIEIDPMSSWKEIVCAAAGPMGSLMLLALSRMLPVIAFCGALQAIWNLLPLYPLDGGRVLQTLVLILFPNRADKVIRCIRCAVMLLLAGFCAAAILLLDLGVFPLLILIGIWVKTGTVKFPCKQRRLGVQ